MADQRFLYSEEVVGANHATKADTINRLSLVEHNNDGSHKFGEVFLQLTGAQAIVTATSTAIIWNSEVVDTDGAHSNATNPTRITVPSGFTKIDLVFQSLWVANTSGTRLIKIVKNGTTDIAVDEKSAAGTLGYADGNVNIICYPCTPGDFFEAVVYQSRGSDLNFDMQSYFAARLYR